VEELKNKTRVRKKKITITLGYATNILELKINGN
jgi:hypothetical protein